MTTKVHFNVMQPDDCRHYRSSQEQSQQQQFLIRVILNQGDTSVQVLDTTHQYNGLVCSLETKYAPFHAKFIILLNSQYKYSTFSVADISRNLCLCEMQGYRKIKSATGMSPGAFLLHFRLIKAFALLLMTDLRIGEIAIEVGFASHNNFSRAFKRVLGVSPKNIRQHFFESCYFQANISDN